MRRLFVALASILSLGGIAANAADMPVKAPGPVVTAPLLYNWSGIYIGGFAGGLWADKDWRFVNTGNPTGMDPDGFFGGAQIGVNWQFTNSWVVGLQFDWGWSGASASSACPNTAYRCETKVNDLGSVTGRLGYAFNNWLVYGKGGAAWVHDKYNATGPSVFTGSLTPAGWTLGLGVEWGFAPNWSVFAEYDYYDFGTKRVGFSGGGVTDDIDVRQRVNIAKLGLNYRFTWLRP